MKHRNYPALLSATLLVLCMPFTARAQAPIGECPQPRFTGKAPDEYYNRKMPSGPATDVKAGESLYRGEEGPVANCVICHGRTGNGKGTLANQYDPPPRNFACAKVVNGIPEGQLFWIIRYGSPGTGMPPHPGLKDDQVWQIVSYLRLLAK